MAFSYYIYHLSGKIPRLGAIAKVKNSGLLLIIKLFWLYSVSAINNRKGWVIVSSITLLMLWGTHGQMELLRMIPGWEGPGSDSMTRKRLIPGIPWDHELISFWSGAVLLVVMPSIIIKFIFKQKLRDYGLGMPHKGRAHLAIWGFLFLLLTCLPAFITGASEPAVNAVYPFYRTFDNKTQFILYELTYLPFFIAIEFIFRGYLLFGLTTAHEENQPDLYKSLSDDFRENGYLLIVSMLSYTAWHLGKPLAELWGTLYWGLAAGTVAFASRSIWPVVLSHWLLNVTMDAMIVF